MPAQLARAILPRQACEALLCAHSTLLAAPLVLGTSGSAAAHGNFQVLIATPAADTCLSSNAGLPGWIVLSTHRAVV
jgi:hypothetical protein